ncbi:MAG: hypothetical protein KAT32_05125 [Candidatus Moranbacteria bacterium]|nr:hypothetical protein [Candidatus Moranbacteria bacterium]
MKKIFNNIIKELPKPFDKNSNLVDFEKKKISLYGKVYNNFRHLVLIKNFFTKFIIFGFLFYFSFLPLEFLVLIYFFSLILEIVKISYIKKLFRKINKILPDNIKNYKTIIYKTNQVDLVNNLFILIRLIFYILFITIFLNKITSLLFSNQYFLNFYENNLILFEYFKNSKIESILAKLIYYYLFFKLFIKVFSFIFSLIRQKIIINLDENKNFAEFDKDFSIAIKKFDLISKLSVTFLIFIPFIFLFFYLKVPYIFILALIGFLFFIIFSHGLSLWEMKRLKNVNLNEQEILNTKVSSVLSDEYMIATIAGILMSTINAGEFSLMSYSFLGVGKNLHPENALILTNCRFIFLQVPVIGGNKVVEDIDYTIQNVLWNRGKIESKLNQMVERGLESALKESSYSYNLPYDSVEKVIIKKKLSVITIFYSGKSNSYSLPDEESIMSILNNLSFLGERLIVKS